MQYSLPLNINVQNSVAKAITDTFTSLGEFEIPECMPFQAGFNNIFHNSKCSSKTKGTILSDRNLFIVTQKSELII